MKQAAMMDAEARVVRGERVIKLKQDDATNAAYAAVDELGGDFTSITQIHPAIQRDLPPETLAALTRQARQNALSLTVAENGEGIADLNQLAATDPAAFLTKDLRLVRDTMTPGEYAGVVKLQEALRADPASPDVIAHRRIWDKIAREGQVVGGVSPAASVAAFNQKAQAMFALVRPDLDAETGGERLPTDQELERACGRAATFTGFDRQSMPALGATSTIFGIADDGAIPTNAPALQGRMVINENQVPTKILDLALTEDEFKQAVREGIFRRLEGDDKKGFKNEKDYKGAVKLVESTASVSAQDVGGHGDEDLIRFVQNVSQVFSGSKIGGKRGQGFERYLTVGKSASGQYVITSIQTVNVGGGSIRPIPGTVAIIHSHRLDFNYDPRAGGADSSVLKLYNIPNFVVGEPSHHPSIYQIGRVNGLILQRLLSYDGKHKNWEKIVAETN